MDGRHSAPTFKVPAGACDCHMHVFGPLDRYPPSPTRSYTPREASLADYDRMTAVVGLQRLVLVQASAYGTDNSCLLDTLKAAGPRARGVAVIDDATTDAELATLNAAGVRGVRVNAETFGVSSAAEIERMLAPTIDRVGPLGWHVQLFASLAAIADLAPMLRAMALPLVIDHMGLAKGPLGPDQPGFNALLSLVGNGAWVKVSGAYRVSSDEPSFPDAAPIAKALIVANPDRIVWGSDWPHTGKHANARLNETPVIEYRPLDDGALLSLLATWADEATVKKVLADNPAALYGFS
ncbi:amidohydrolase family protein [Starkeya sp. ORNL1]|uniref:amidohydrolase family protein n=1 Tax=Starkeya sp. ORNL1 TaxID=2709380 RepID=UPI0014634E4A|nr:amidohydrolase family protein [Starkeya sp. ORNL1]QJP14593.1 amidohydrolase family protein [Starkeya sp. ORNL1]